MVTLQLTIVHDQDIPEGAELDNLVVYPNPTTGNVVVSAEDVVKIEIFDFLGRMAAVYTNTSHLDLSALPSGSYTLRITLPQGTAIRRVVKK